MNLKNHINSALFYLTLTAVLGVILRSFGFLNIPVQYKYIVHTHSHIALLGWVYLALTTLLVKVFLYPEARDKKYRNLFLFTQLSLCGMLLTFPLQGYGVYSIAFSTLFLFASYGFFWFFSKHVREDLKGRYSYKFIKASLWYMVISSAGPWALGGIMASLGPTSICYRLAIYFYLHFQYNGWMMMALAGMMLYILEQRQCQFPERIFKAVYWGLNTGIILSLLLSALWAKPPLVVHYLGGLGALIQLGAVVLFLMFVWTHARNERFSVFRKRLLQSMGILVLIKLIMQGIAAIPYFSELSVRVIDFTIGYLHFIFLGIITPGIFLILEYFKMLKMTKGSYVLYFIGFALMEGLIFYRGAGNWLGFPLIDFFQIALSLVSLFLAIVIVGILISNIVFRPTRTNY